MPVASPIMLMKRNSRPPCRRVSLSLYVRVGYVRFTLIASATNSLSRRSSSSSLRRCSPVSAVPSSILAATYFFIEIGLIFAQIFREHRRPRVGNVQHEFPRLFACDDLDIREFLCIDFVARPVVWMVVRIHY